MNIKEELIEENFPEETEWYSEEENDLSYDSLIQDVSTGSQIEETEFVNSEDGTELTSNSFTEDMDTTSQVAPNSPNIDNVNATDPFQTFSQEKVAPSKIEPTQMTQFFQSEKVQKGSQTPYSDATNVPHDPQKIKRPMNAFMIFAHYERKKINQDQSNVHNAIVSRNLGKRWKEMPAQEKYPYMQEAERLRQFHLIQYPDYKYKPKKKEKYKHSESFMARRNITTQSQFALARAGQCSFKISNCFGSNSWVNSPVSELCNGRTQLLNVDINNLGFKLIVDNSFKTSLKNPRNARESRRKVPVKNLSLPTSSYYSSGSSNAPSALSSQDASSVKNIKHSSVEPPYEVNKADDIVELIEEFMSEPTTPTYQPSVPSPFFYITPPSHPQVPFPVQNQQQIDSKWYQQQKIYQQQHLQQLQQLQQQKMYQEQQQQQKEQQQLQQQKIYQQQQQHQNQLLWQQQQFRYQNTQPNNTIF